MENREKHLLDVNQLIHIKVHFSQRRFINSVFPVRCNVSGHTKCNWLVHRVSRILFSVHDFFNYLLKRQPSLANFNVLTGTENGYIFRADLLNLFFKLQINISLYTKRAISYNFNFCKSFLSLESFKRSA